MTGSVEDAADLTQQTFCQALGRWDRFDGAAQPTTWLHQILLNCIRDWARRRAARPGDALDEWAVVAATGAEARPDDCLGRKEQMLCMRRAIENLPLHLRTAFATTVLDGYSYQETADLLSVPVGTIASRVHQARMQVLSVMRRHFPEA